MSWHFFLSVRYNQYGLVGAIGVAVAKEQMRQITDEEFEQFIAYQQVAALVCMDIELLQDIVQNGDHTAEQLRKHIAMIHENMLDAQTNKESRVRRWEAGVLLFNLGVKKEPWCMSCGRHYVDGVQQCDCLAGSTDG